MVVPIPLHRIPCLAGALGLLLGGFGFPVAALARVLPSADARATPVDEARFRGVPADADLEHLGARIGEIQLDSRQLFDVGRRDQDTALSRIANRLHIPTREATIEDQLLFRRGDEYRAGLLKESARLLRDTPYLREADVRPIAYHDGVVDVKVTTQDVWTLNPGLSFGRKGGKNSAGVSFEELNLLGLGTQIGIEAASGVDRDTRTIYYRDRQLGSSWWNLASRFSNNSDGRLAEFSLERPFYALDSRWAGGVSLAAEQRINTRYDLGGIVDQYRLDHRAATLYWGRSAGLVNGWTRRYSLGFTFDDLAFAPASGVHDTRLLPEDRRLASPWAGIEWVQNDFRTERNRDQIERTEDRPMGWRGHARLGLAAGALGSDRDALVLDTGVSKGWVVSARQSLSFDAGAAGRIEQGSVRGGKLGSHARYYFRQSPRRLLVLDLSGEVGARPDVDQQILLGGDSGLRGYPLRYQAGEGRWVFTAEQRLFTNWYPFQLFNVGAAVFCDMGATWGRDPLGTPSLGLLRDVGIGLRLGNSRSALGNVLHLDLALPLDGDPSLHGVQFLVETRRSF